VIRASGRTGSAEGTEHPDAKRDFEAAMSLVKGKKYDKAIEAFDGFLGRFSDSPRAENAMYWRGECLFAKSDWARAAEQFEAVLARYPQGQKSPDALLKLGLSYARSSDKDKAHDAFAKLKSQYPKSDAAKQAPRD
jgi:tol-pal system protein YbgF